jgi:cysteine-rich repeat protein
MLTRFLRVYPVTWNGTKIALRFDVLRRLECGDGFWDEMQENCDDGNVVSGDGCSGTSGEWQGTVGPCEKETFTTRTDYNSKYPQRYKDGRDSGHTVARPGVPPMPRAQTQWCHRGSDCFDCTSLRVNPIPKRYFDEATQQHFDDPLHMQECAGRRSRSVGADGVVQRDRPAYPDDGFIYRTKDTRALGTRHRPASTLP